MLNNISFRTHFFLICILVSLISANGVYSESNVKTKDYTAVVSIYEYKEDTFLALVIKNIQTEQILKNKDYIIETNAQRKQKKTDVISNEIWQKDLGIVVIHAVNMNNSMDLQYIKIKGPSDDETDETIKYIGVYTGEYGSVNADKLEL
ncbi:hypothetical protein [Bartonella bilalgolemii]|uniref:Uncharacterized protein n=1 Tax=Bartonella bilalgolemii TaxID=2942911 RepID=A0ABT0P9V4_9HYPH|nr:hypothetical protein [Bartonella sp. G70]MCL6230221.1 hypothetical protein [Bartonella sp. G70]